MGNMEEIRIEGYRGNYQETPQAEELGLSSDEFDIYVERTNHHIGDISPGNVVITATTLVVAGAGVLSAAINGFFNYLANRNGGSIKITGKDGTSVEVPEGTGKSELDDYIRQAQEIDAIEIVGHLSNNARALAKEKDGI